MRHFTTIFSRAALAALCVSLTIPSGALASRSIEGIVPQTASAMGRQIDRQIAERLGQGEGLTLSITVPVDVNDLDASNPLARQMAEELARWFTQAGYGVQEMRKGRVVLVEPGNGEKLLTRRVNLLSRRTIPTDAIMSGTYVVTNKNVRFNIRILSMGGQNVLGMATASVPITSEVRSLLAVKGGTAASYGGATSGPSVGTMLP